jgi:thiol-disulfide isomerase/thioredoxin
VSKPANTPRGREAARRARSRRLRRLGFAAAGAVLVAIVALVAIASSGKTSSSPSVGAVAPAGSFTTSAGGSGTIASLRGRATLVWFVATWCSSCQTGTQAMAAQIPTFAAQRVRVVELELANDLGQSGPSITAFGQQLAGAAYDNPDWTFGVASAGLTATYDPAGYLDIYYLLDSSGHVTYVNSSPGATMGSLLGQVAKLKAA